MDQSDVLEIAARHPAVSFAHGDAVVVSGERSTSLLVLVSGELVVRTGGREIARITQPGSVVGEIGLLLGAPASADVESIGDTVMHRIDDATALFTEYPGLGQHLAVVLAARLRRVTTFLTDVDQQFADRTPTLGLVPDVLSQLLSGAVRDVDTGSEREPDSPY